MVPSSDHLPAHGQTTRWRPAPTVRLTVAAHIAGAATFAWSPESWPWVVAALGGNHLSLAAVGMWPRSGLLGPNLVRLPESARRRGEVALTFDDGPDPLITPRVLDELDRHTAKASFFCIGAKAAAFPDIVREIARRGHSVENHSQRHSNGFACYGLGTLRREVQTAQATIGNITGQAPVFFRAPMGFRTALLDPVLTQLGLRYVSWTRRGYDTRERDPSRVLRRLVNRLAAGDVLLLHDRAGALTRGSQPVVLAALPALLDRLAAAGLHSVSLRAALDAT
jgi:peptidoglycan-N-acetylglucosamine deacetylase